jgi:hypothetical protein
MRLLVDLVPLLILAGVVWVVVERTRMGSHARTELANLRAFKDTVRDAALTEIELDSASPLGRIILDEVHQVDLANSSRKKGLA